MLKLDEIISRYPVQLRHFPRGILREYLQYKILEHIFASSIASKLSFIGGTALRLIYDNQRFSEDLDFDNFGITNEEFETFTEHLRSELIREGYAVETTLTHKGAHRCSLKFLDILFTNNLTPHDDEKLLIQIDTQEQGYGYEPERKLIKKFDLITHVSVTPRATLLAQKLYTITNRKRAKGRDFFDTTFLVAMTKPDYGFLQMKLGARNAEEIRKIMLNAISALDFHALAEDVKPFLFREEDARRIELFPEFIKEAEL